MKSYFAATVVDAPLVSTDSRLESWLDIGPGALVFVFLLSPDQLSVAVLVAFLHHQIEGERADLFNGGQCDLVLESCISSGLQEIIVNFAGAENDLFATGWILRSGSVIGNNPLELGAWDHLIEARFALRVSQ